MKTIIPVKLIISNDGNGNIASAIFVYRIRVNGATGNSVYSIDVKDALTIASLSSLFSTAVAQANQTEGAT